MNKEQIAYLAGLIDGDGTIAVYKNKNKYTPYITIANNNRRVLEWCKKLIGKGTISTKKPKKETYAESYALRWIYDDAINIASLCLPYLIVKRKRAGLLLKWKGVTHRNGNYTKENWQKKMGLIKEMYRLNRVKEN